MEFNNTLSIAVFQSSILRDMKKQFKSDVNTRKVVINLGINREVADWDGSGKEETSYCAVYHSWNDDFWLSILSKLHKNRKCF